VREDAEGWGKRKPRRNKYVNPKASPQASREINRGRETMWIMLCTFHGQEILRAGILAAKGVQRPHPSNTLFFFA